MSSVLPTGAQLPPSGLSCPAPQRGVSSREQAWGGGASPQTLTFEDGDVHSGMHAGQQPPRLPSAVGDSRGPGRAAALHTGTLGRPQARPGPYMQPQEEQEARGCRPYQSLVGEQRGSTYEEEGPQPSPKPLGAVPPGLGERSGEARDLPLWASRTLRPCP